jgi:hypothetical protein
MIKTYDEALKTMSNVRKYLAINRADDCVEELDKVARYFINEKHKENPTLSECIKEWNEKGFDVDVYALEIVIYNYSTVDKEEDEIEISIRLDLKTISYTNDVELSFDLHHLLSKTLKALEVEK